MDATIIEVSQSFCNKEQERYVKDGIDRNYYINHQPGHSDITTVTACRGLRITSWSAGNPACGARWACLPCSEESLPLAEGHYKDIAKNKSMAYLLFGIANQMMLA